MSGKGDWVCAVDHRGMPCPGYPHAWDTADESTALVYELSRAPRQAVCVFCTPDAKAVPFTRIETCPMHEREVRGIVAEMLHKAGIWA